MDGRATPMVLATAALAAFALLLAAPVSAYVPEGDGVHANGTQSRDRQQAQVTTQGSIPYLSHGIGVDKSQFAGETSQVDARHQALAGNRDATSSPVGLDPAIQTAIEARSGGAQVGQQATAPLPHGIQVVMSPQSEEQQTFGLSGDSAATRTPVPDDGLGAAVSGTTYPSHVIGGGSSQWDGRALPVSVDVGSTETPRLTATSSGSDFDWESFGAGAGTAALLAAGFVGILLATRRRHTVGMS